MQVKDLGQAAAKYKTRAANAAGDYKQGVQGAGPRWKEGVTAANDTWKAGVQAAAARDAFQKGVSRTAPDYFASRAANLGGARYAQGVSEGASNWSEGFQPYAETLRGLNLGPKAPRGDPRNAQRSADVQQALHSRRVNG